MKDNAGYSLLEVLIAFAVMSLVLSAVIPGQARVLSRATEKDEAVLAYDYALSKIAAIGYETPLEAGGVQFDYRDWSVEVVQEPISDTAFPNGMMHVIVTVLDKSAKLIAVAETSLAVK